MAKNSVPDTRTSLILRLPDKNDVEAWDEFVAIYEPLVYRLARSKGLQDSDAREVVQEVMLSVSQAVERWEPNPARGRFRDWLFCIARNLLIKYLTRRKYKRLGTGGSGAMAMLSEHADPDQDELATIDLELRRAVFRWAAEKVKLQVQENTWKAFWLTSVDGQGAAVVATQLSMTVGAVHIARSRVRGRLRDVVARFEMDQSNGEQERNERGGTES